MMRNKCTVEDKGDYYRIGYLSATLNSSERIVSKQSVEWFCIALLSMNKLDRDNYAVFKTKLQSFIWQHRPETMQYKIDDIKASDKDFSHHELYAALLQGGLNKKYYYEFYILPLKVIEFYGCVQLERDVISVKKKSLEKFMKKRLIKHGIEVSAKR